MPVSLSSDGLLAGQVEDLQLQVKELQKTIDNNQTPKTSPTPHPAKVAKDLSESQNAENDQLLTELSVLKQEVELLRQNPGTTAPSDNICHRTAAVIDDN